MAELFCLALLAARPVGSAHHAEALRVCVAVYLAADAAGEDPEEVAAQAGVESDWTMDARTPDGSAGPLQAKPVYFCPGKTRRGCDLIAAGIEARRRFRAALIRWGMRQTPTNVLCAYQKGREHKGGGCAYATKVLKLARRAKGLVP